MATNPETQYYFDQLVHIFKKYKRTAKAIRKAEGRN